MRTSLLPIVGMVVTAASAPAFATIEPVDQDRSVSAFIILPQCAGVTAWDDDESTGFMPFDGFATVEEQCPGGSASATAEQDSLIGTTHVEAEGSTLSSAAATVQNVIHAISGSFFEVTFDLDEPSRFSFSGGLNAAGMLPVVLSGAITSLRHEDGTIVFQHQLAPGPNGAPNGTVVEESGALAPGRYVLRASASTVIDASVPPEGSGSASFHVIFGTTVTGDATGDGVVNVDDLLAVIVGWGGCGACASCPADLNGDCMVNVDDLVTVILNWSA